MTAESAHVDADPILIMAFIMKAVCCLCDYLCRIECFALVFMILTVGDE
jgi:hypothetical protein